MISLSANVDASIALVFRCVQSLCLPFSSSFWHQHHLGHHHHHLKHQCRHRLRNLHRNPRNCPHRIASLCLFSWVAEFQASTSCSWDLPHASAVFELSCLQAPVGVHFAVLVLQSRAYFANAPAPLRGVCRVLDSSQPQVWTTCLQKTPLQVLCPSVSDCAILHLETRSSL